MLVQLQKDVTIVSTKLDRVIEDVDELDEHVDDLRSKLSFVRGCIITAGVLLALFGSVFWWFFGGQINEIRDKLYRQQNPSAQQQLTTP